MNGGTMDERSLAMMLAEFFLDSLREDAGDVENWCSQNGDSVDDIVADIKRHLGLSV
jgi:hypothetical protein